MTTLSTIALTAGWSPPTDPYGIDKALAERKAMREAGWVRRRKRS